MSDVRLTATNPEDSTVVPVACNSKGELLIEDIVVSNIDNNLTLTGDILWEPEGETEFNYSLKLNQTTGNMSMRGYDPNESTWVAYANGNFRLYNRQGDVRNTLNLSTNSTAILVQPNGGAASFRVYWDGTTTSNRLMLATEADKPEHYSPVKNAETGEETSEYIGPVVDVGEELKFLRTQLRQTMEKLKMTPEGGWEVWDGSTET